MRAAAGQLAHGLDRVGLAARVDAVHRADRLGQCQRLVVDVHADDVGPHGAGDHDGRKPHAAAAVHDHPLAAADPPLGHHGPVGGDEAAAQRGGLHVAHGLGQHDQIGVGVGDGHILGERSPGREAGLEVVVADVLVAGDALVAGAAADGEGHGDAFAHASLAHLLAHGHDLAGQLMAGHMGQHDVRVVAGPAVPIAAADAVGLDADHHAVVGGGGVGDGLEGGELVELFVEDCFHGISYFPFGGIEENVLRYRQT